MRPVSFQGLLLLAFLFASVAFLVFAPVDSPTGLVGKEHSFGSSGTSGIFLVLIAFILLIGLFVMSGKGDKKK